MASTTATTREFPPLYTPTGYAVRDQLAFFHLLERLKTQKRTGWVDNNIPNPESIADHMYRMAMLAMCTSDEKLDITKYREVIIAWCSIQETFRLGLQVCDDVLGARSRRGARCVRWVQRRRESEAIHNIVHDMLHNSPAAQRIEALWKEYEERQTPEALFVKDLDRFEMASQALEYERAHGAPLQPFFDSSLPYLHHPEVKECGTHLAEERVELHRNAKME